MNYGASQITSPLTGGGVRHVDSVSALHIARLYTEALGFDVAPFLDLTLTFDLLECVDTGYRFYAPLDKVEGSPGFYASLYSTAGTEWGYEGGKWEHRFALKHCANSDKLLDVGCGGGAFLAMARQHVEKCVGLETSPHGLRACKEAGVTALDEVIQTHRISHPRAYDVVCSFQVLEHVSRVKEFIESCISVVKPGGKVIFSVPNNEGFVGAQELPLNMPPHHVGCWSASSLEALTRFFDLDLVGMHHEPLQASNINWYQSWLESRYLPENRILRSLWHRLGFATSLGRFLQDNASTIHGHTVMAVYRVK